MYRFITILSFSLFGLFLVCGFSFADQKDPSSDIHASKNVMTGPKVYFPVKEHRFGEVFEGTDIKYDFVIENPGDAPLVIKNIRPD